MARGLSKRESNSIGVVLPQLDMSFFSKILTGIGAVADKNDLTVILCNTDNSAQKERRALQVLREQHVKGLLLTSTEQYMDMEERRKLQGLLSALDIPTVLIDRKITNTRFDGVYFDNFNGAFWAAEALITGGNRTIGAIIADLKLELGEKRYEGFLAALKTHGLRSSPEHMFLSEGSLSPNDVYIIIMKMIERGNLPHALFFSNELISKGFFKAMLEKGLESRRDLCFIGFDYNEVLDFINLNYSYVERNAREMGRKAMQMLLERFEKPLLSRREYIIPVNLVLNGSERKADRQLKLASPKSVRYLGN
jgi:LacI family transcriptional regulator